ncbi:helix-turn-helix domain-containing protein [Streptomyces sp. CB00455]|uniref:helix-turn-helix domain-containing protein n=1 Tax=Streptomyces sp. CB00455 TaxID=1703927 RepID=UPI000ACA3A03|nr:helix-turn-helix domain-containing protein [Streptomyces sp. CB00455]
MARPMNQLPQSDDPLIAFARDLRHLHKKAGSPPLAMMAERSGISAPTLSNAHNGRKLPTWSTVNAYVLACGGDPEEWSPRWESLRLAGAGLSGGLGREALAHWERTGILTPIPVTDEAGLRQLLRALLDFNGLSHRTLARQAPGYSHVTYGAVLRGTRPLRAKILYQILIGCGVHSLRSQEAWFVVLSSFSGREGLEGGKLLTRVDQKYRYAGDVDLKILKAVLPQLERGRALLISNVASYDSVVDLRTAFEDMLAILLGSLERSSVQLPLKLSIAFDQVIRQLQSASFPNPAALAALVPLTLPFHPRLQTRVSQALKNAGDVLRKVNDGELPLSSQKGNRRRAAALIPRPPRFPTASSVRAVS